MRGLVSDAEGLTDVIVAPATPPGVSAVAIVRLTGPAGRTLDVARRLAPGLSGDPRPRMAVVTPFLDERGAEVDEGLALFFPAPRSATGEEVVELHAHGSPAVVEALLAAARRAGARPARAGEFTRRALANGKLDLSQAEGVAALIAAESRLTARRAFGLVRGALTRRIADAREELLDLLAELEATLDFPEDMGLRGGAARAGRLGELAELFGGLAERAAGASDGRQPVVVLAGRPNAGKSTLFNALLGRDRAIVTPVAGTTRDAVAETWNAGGLRVRLVDTAGVRETVDEVERIGVAVAREAAAAADLVLCLVDGSEEDVEGEVRGGPVLRVRTKSDLAPGNEPRDTELRVSAVTGEGLAELAKAVAGRLGSVETEGELPALERHREALGRAAEALGEAAVLGGAVAIGGSAVNAPPGPATADDALVAAALRRAVHALGEITGETAGEELLDRIFSRFCIGK